MTGGTAEQVWVFGDDTGDMQMLREAGIGVLMCDARKELLEQHTTISACGHDKDGVARFLEAHFQLS